MLAIGTVNQLLHGAWYSQRTVINSNSTNTITKPEMLQETRYIKTTVFNSILAFL